MTVFEILYPGTWIELADRDVAYKVRLYLSTIESALNDAAMAMSLFEQAMEHQPKGTENGSNSLSVAAGPDDPEKFDSAQFARECGGSPEAFLRELSLRALEARRRRWRSGEIPQVYSSRLPFIYARSFLFSVWTIGKLFDQITKCEGLPPDAIAAAKDFATAFPTLKGLRDSSAHVDERVSGQARGAPIDSQPIENRFVSAPGGGVLLVENLLGRCFTGICRLTSEPRKAQSFRGGTGLFSFDSSPRLVEASDSTSTASPLPSFRCDCLDSCIRRNNRGWE